MVALIGPDDPVLAAVCVQPKGAGNAMAVGGVAGALMAGRKENREATQQTGIEAPRWAALAVTKQRLSS